MILYVGGCNKDNQETYLQGEQVTFKMNLKRLVKTTDQSIFGKKRT